MLSKVGNLACRIMREALVQGMITHHGENGERIPEAVKYLGKTLLGAISNRRPE